MTARDLLAPFAAYGRTLPISLPDRALQGLYELTASDYRAAVAAMDSGELPQIQRALWPFMEAGKLIPAKAREWQFGTGPLTYGDFIRASEFTEAA